MGYDYSAGYVDTFMEGMFTKKFPALSKRMEEFKLKFINTTELSGTDLSIILNEVYYSGLLGEFIKNPESDFTDRIIEAINKTMYYDDLEPTKELIGLITEYMCTASEFYRDTGGLGLTTYFCDEPLRGSDIDSFEWGVENLYQLTPLGKKFEEMLTRRFYIY